jgi:hypothetical protein
MENVISNDLDIDLGSKFHAAMNRDSKNPNLWGYSYGLAHLSSDGFDFQ